MINNGKLKIGDFGFAKKSDASSKIANHTIVGTPYICHFKYSKAYLTHQNVTFGH